MGEKHHLMRHEDKEQTQLRRHTLWTTALLWPEQVGGQGRGDGWVNYNLGGRRLESELTRTKQTTGWNRKSKPILKADTPWENSNSKENIHRTVLLQILGKKSSMKPQRNRQRILNINSLANDENYKKCVKRSQNGLVTTSHAAKMIHG